jgi:hypothetical protein
MEKQEIKELDGYAIGFLDGYLLTRDVVEKELDKCNLKKDSSERLANEFRFIQECINANRISVVRRQFEML